MTQEEKYPAFFDRFTLWLTQDEAESGSHQGNCAYDIAELLKTDAIKNQMRTFNPDHIREELSGYGAWDDEELADDEANKSRLLWIACGNVREESYCSECGGDWLHKEGCSHESDFWE